MNCLQGFLSFPFLSCFFLRLFRFPFRFLSVITNLINTMTIQVKHELTKSRNPTEYDMRLENRKGEIVHSSYDGYYLIEFELKIKKIIKVDRKKIVKNVKLQWYVHENDFFIANLT